MFTLEKHGMMLKTNNCFVEEESMEICKLDDNFINQTLQIYKSCLNQKSLSESTLKITNSYPYNHIYIAKIKSQVLGMIDYTILSNESYLNNIAILPKYRNQKIASNLMQNMINMCKNQNVKSISLEVRYSNHVAISFYEKFNFIKLAKRSNLYSQPTEDGWVMELAIK